MSGYNDVESSGHWLAVTPDDNADLTGGITRGILVGGAGTVAAVSQDGDDVALPALVAGIVHPFKVKRVKSTGTTATSIIAVY